MISACAKELIQDSAEFTIQSMQDFAEVAHRAKFVRALVERLGNIGDVYWSSDGSVEIEPTDKPVFALTIKDRKRWTYLSIRALRRGLNGQVHSWAYELDLTNEFAIDRFLFAVNDSFPQLTKSMETR